jgi:hypothetical protein
MSLSTLGSQLAALNAPGKNLGSALPSSRRHDDAVGRGISHSVQLGHSISKKNHLFKASIIYEDARKAADVPLVTIRENCVSSLRQLESLDAEFGTFVDSLCKNTYQQERGLVTAAENERTDELVESLLYRLALRMGSTANNSKVTTASCLHVVEFLLRRYDMHLRPKTAGTALLVMLPLHEEPFFLRLVQLIDLANMPAWAFLRPYAAPGAKVARQVVSKQASKDKALLRDICRLAQRNSKLPNNMQSLSFSAAVIVEAVTLQLQKFGSMEERTCQVILPYVVEACRQSRNTAYQNWGHVTASAVVETSALAEEPLEIVVTSILKGIVGSRDTVLSNGLLVALATLSQPLDGVDPRSYQLPIIGSSLFCGYPMGMNVFQALLEFDELSAKFGHLYSSDGITEFSHWIASSLVVGWKFLQESNDSSRMEKARALIMDFIQEPRLKSLWTNSSSKWVESFCAFVITNTSFDSKKMIDKDETFLKAVLKSLRSIDVMAYENGLASALIRKKKSDREKISSWLGLKRVRQEGSASSEGEPESECFVLPPRVALEHADDSVRLESIRMLLQEEEDSENEMMEGDGETVVQALMRRFTDDDNDKVAIAASEALCQLLVKGKKYDTAALGEGSLRAVYKWAQSHSVDENARTVILVQALRVVTHVSMKAMAEGSMNSLLVRLVECLGAYSASPEASVAQQGALSLLHLFKGTKTKSKAFKNAHLLLVSRDELLGLFRRNIGKAGKAEQSVRRLCMKSLLEGFSASLSAVKKSRDKLASEKLEKEAMEYCLWVVTSFSDDLNASEKTLLAQCLSQTTVHIASSPQLLRKTLHEFASSGSPVFSEILSPLIIEICDRVKDSRGGKVSGLAVLMEFTLASSSISNVVVKNLLSTAKEYVESDRSAELIHFAVAPTLCLLSNDNEGIRKMALELFALMGKSLSENTKSEWGVLAEVSSFITENRSSALMGDASFLPGCLASVVSKSGKKSQLQKCLLDLCVYASLAFSSEDATDMSNVFDNGWMDASEATGGHLVALTILRAAEEAGEDCFPVNTRWQIAGKPILDGLLASSSSAKKVPISMVALIDVVIRMLKGVKVVDSIAQAESNANIIIMSGPASRGGRARSYSFGKNDSITFLKPYPKGMQESIVSILNKEAGSVVTMEVQNSLFLTVLGSQSWKSRVFANLPKSVRRKLAVGVLTLSMQDMIETSDETLFSLPLHSSEVADMIGGQQKLPSFLAAVSYLADYTTMNCKRLVEDVAVKDLFSALFTTLSTLSSTITNEEEDVGFARQSILSALLELSGALSQTTTKDLAAEKKFKSWIDLLVKLLAGDSSNMRGMRTIRGKRTILALLTSLCSQYPSAVADKLIPAMEATLSNTRSQKEAGVLVECIALIVPTYLQHSSSVQLSPLHLFTSFINATTTEEDEIARIKLYQGFIGALPTATRNCDTRSLAGGFTSSCLAAELYLAVQGGKALSEASSLSHVATQILQNSSIRTKISVVWSMLSYGKEIILDLLGESYTSQSNDSVSLGDLDSLASRGPSKRTTGKQRTVISKSNGTAIKLCNLLMIAVCETVSSTPFQKFLRQLEGDTSTDILLFWQDLILIQIACQNMLGGSVSVNIGEFWETMNDIANDILGSLQKNLPTHIFLAFASSLIKEGGTEELRARAAQLIADRSVSLGASDPEAGLFRDMLPFLTSLLDARDGNGKLLQQSALVAIESIARALCLGTVPMMRTSQVEQLSTAISKSADLIQAEIDAFDGSSVSFEGISRSSRQVVCSASLCASTCIRACGPRSLASLPKLMNPLTSFLSAANRFLSTCSVDRTEQGQAKMMQMSILRSIIAVTETLPQFLAPYLKDLFNPFGLPSGWLRKDVDDQSVSVMNTAESLDEILVSHVPARLLIPVASQSLVTNQYDSTSLLSLLSLLNASTSKSKGSELSGHATTLLHVVTHVFESFDNADDREVVFSASSELFLALVLKLSEVQLRSLYVRLRDWRGDFDKLNPNRLASRRAAFWDLSASLGKQLRSIYLPCLGTVFSDVVDELVSGGTAFSIFFSENARHSFLTVCACFTGDCCIASLQTNGREKSRGEEEAAVGQ